MKLSSDTKWSSIYVTSSFLSNIGHGLIVAVVGPTQPYLARNVQAEIDSINFVWTFGFLGYLLGSFTGIFFRRFFHSDLAKLSFLWFSISVSGAMMISLPFVTDFVTLAALRLLQNVALGAYIVVDTSMLVFTMGPIRSRPFTNALHCSIGLGFFISSWLIRPFLPTDDKSNQSRDVFCNSTNNSTSTEIGDLDTTLGLSNLVWPFLITGSFCIVVGSGYLILWLLPWTMPRFYEQPEEQKNESNRVLERAKSWKLMLIFVFFYYILSCGTERIYQPMAYTLGYCGPLKLTAKAAVAVDSTYNGGFMVGRFVSIFVVMLLRPRNMIIMSLVGCILASILLCTIGNTYIFGLYTGTALLGFCISWQFGSCYSYVAKKMDITGSLSPLFFVGCGLGSAIFPPLSGYAFTSSWGQDSILHLTLIVSLVQCFNFAAIWFLGRKKEIVSKTSQELEQDEDLQMRRSNNVD